MLAYAANAPRAAVRRQSPNAMLFIVAGHVALIAAVISAKMDLPTKIRHDPTVVRFIPLPKEPPVEQPRTDRPMPRPTQPSKLDQPPPFVPVPPTDGPIVDATPTLPPSFDDLIGPKLDPQPKVQPIPRPLPPARVGPQLVTSPDELRPPYPASKLASEEEAVLRLKLTIDERGRVIAVDPVGRADPAFLQAARRHVIARWRYKPASEGGRAVGSTRVVTLRFELNG